MLPRIVLVSVAVAAGAWLAVLWRDERVGRAADQRLFSTKAYRPAAFERDIARLRDANLLNPDPHWDILRAGYLEAHGRPRSGAALAERVVRREPDNLEAWLVLLRATRHTDPRRAAEAAVAMQRLSPLSSPASRRR